MTLSLDTYQSLNCNRSYLIEEPRERMRFKKILDYIELHHKAHPRLEDAAALVHMHPSSLCRFLKLHASKTFVGLLNEFRVQKACTLLIESELSISQVAYESGFHTLSFFNKKFSELMKSSPRAYRKKYYA